MDYDSVVEKLREKIETLQQDNIQLRDEMAVLSNANYTLECDHALMMVEMEENQVQQQEMNALAQQFEQIREELLFIKASNTYKVWVRYRKIPVPIRRVFRGIFAPIKMVYKGIKKVVK